MYRVKLEFIMDDIELDYFYEWIQKKPKSQSQMQCWQQSVSYEV
jgi:hypothetical protein